MHNRPSELTGSSTAAAAHRCVLWHHPHRRMPYLTAALPENTPTTHDACAYAYAGALTQRAPTCVGMWECGYVGRCVLVCQRERAHAPTCRAVHQPAAPPVHLPATSAGVPSLLLPPAAAPLAAAAAATAGARPGSASRVCLQKQVAACMQGLASHAGAGPAMQGLGQPCRGRPAGCACSSRW